VPAQDATAAIRFPDAELSVTTPARDRGGRRRAGPAGSAVGRREAPVTGPDERIDDVVAADAPADDPAGDRAAEPGGDGKSAPTDQPDPTALTSVAQDYLKVVWSAGEWSTAPVTTKMLAERLGVGAPTVSETVRRLCAQGLLRHPRYGAVELTPLGRAHAVVMVRRHRLIETFLVRELGYGWDEVHDEAEVLEHAVSDLLVERLAARLGHPTRDPHGDPIPTAEGHLPVPTARLLRDLEPGRWVVARISDADPALLRSFAELGLGLDVPVEVLAGADRRGVVSVRVAGRTADLDPTAAAAVWLEPAEESAEESAAGPARP
jgi:DtxR family Mn-dependent transcriptional regulator